MSEVKRIKIDERIKAYNEANPDKRQLSRKLLSERVECSFSLINNLQSGIVGKGMKTLVKLSEILECTVEDLIDK